MRCVMDDKTLKKRLKKVKKLEKKLLKQQKKLQKLSMQKAKAVLSLKEVDFNKDMTQSLSGQKNAHFDLTTDQLTIGSQEKTNNDKHQHIALNLVDIETSELNQMNKEVLEIEIAELDTVHLDEVYRPYKSSPCKKCPALAGGMCKCALKRINKVA